MSKSNETANDPAKGIRIHFKAFSHEISEYWLVRDDLNVLQRNKCDIQVLEIKITWLPNFEDE